jgi:hypothetical protein
VGYKDKYRSSSGVLEPRDQMPRAKASVRIVPTWGERKAAGGVAGGVKPVRPVLKPVRSVWIQQGAREDHVWFEDQWMVTSLCDE